MYTAVYELYRREDLSQQEFADYWLNVHKPIAVKMPKVRAYEIWPVTHADGVEGSEVAGFVILRFDSEADFEECHASPEFAATAEDAMKFARLFTHYAVDEHKII